MAILRRLGNVLSCIEVCIALLSLSWRGGAGHVRWTNVELPRSLVPLVPARESPDRARKSVLEEVEFLDIASNATKLWTLVESKDRGKNEDTPATLVDGVGSRAPPASVKVQLHGLSRTQVHRSKPSLQ